MAFSLSSLKPFSALQGWACSSSEQVFAGYPRPSTLFLPRHSLSTSIVTLSRRRNSKSAIPKKKKRNASVEVTREEKEEEEEDMDDDAFEALFSMLEEDLKNNGSPIDDNDDDDISEEDFEKLQRALEEALGIGDVDDDESGELLNSAGDVIDIEEHDDDDEEEEEDEDEEEKPVQLKNWQLRRLARALKTGRRKTNIKSVAAELCLDRAIVLELLRDPPPNLVMMSAALRDEPVPSPTLDSEKSEPIDVVPVEVETVDDSVKSESEKKVPVHVMRQRWSAKKRLKKVHVETLERVYRKTKRPTNAMVSSIGQVTNLPRKRIVQWFEDRRNEDGVPEQRAPYQRTNSFTSQTE